MTTKMNAAVPKDTGWSWMCILGAAICMFYVVGTFKSLGLLFVEFLTEFNASDAITAWLLGLTACGMSILAPVANYIASKYSSRFTVAVGTISCSIAFLLSSVAPNIYAVVCLFGIFSGVGYAGIYGPSLLMVGVYFEKRRSFANGLAAAGASVGQLVIPLFMTRLISVYSLRGALVIYAAFHLHGLVAAMLLRPPEFYTRHRHKVVKQAEDFPNTGKKLSGNDTPEPELGRIVTPEPEPGGNDTPEPEHDASSSEQKVTAKVGLAQTAPPDVNIAAPTLSSALSNADAKLIESSGELGDSEPGLTRLRNRLKCTDDHYTSKESLYIIDGQNVPPDLIEEEKRLMRSLSESNKDDSNMREAENETETGRCSAQGVLHVICGFYQWHHFSNALFIIYALCHSLGCTNYINHFVFIPPRALEIGVGKDRAALMLSVIGITDLIGRVMGGFIADLPFINRGYLMGGSLVVTGIASIVTTLFPSYVSMLVFCVILGAVGGTFVSVMAVVLIDFLGLEKFSSAFGLALMCQGLTNTAWPSFLGWLKDYTGSYETSFYVAGSFLVLSGSCMFFEKCARRIEARKVRRREKQGHGKQTF